MILYKYHKNIFENIKTEVKIRIFTPLITSWLGFGDFQQNQENSDMIRMAGQSVLLVEYNLLYKKHLSFIAALSWKKSKLYDRNTKQNINSNNFACETPWLPDYYANTNYVISMEFWGLHCRLLSPLWPRMPLLKEGGMVGSREDGAAKGGRGGGETKIWEIQILPELWWLHSTITFSCLSQGIGSP